jgi:hypothetical protein
MFACACFYLLCVANRLRYVPELRGIDDQDLVNHWSRDQLLEFYEIEYPGHLFGEAKCPLTHYVSFTL